MAYKVEKSITIVGNDISFTVGPDGEGYGEVKIESISPDFEPSVINMNPVAARLVANAILELFPEPKPEAIQTL